MKKRKILGSVLAATLAFGSVFPAFATGGTNITIDGTGNQYQAYRVLNLTTSLKAGDEHAAGEHTSDCYNYSYTINEKYRAALQSALDGTGADADNNGAISDQEILNYLSSLSGDDHAAAVRAFADKMWAQIRSLEADATATNKAFSDMSQGYYLIAETEKGDNPDAISLVMLDTAGQTDIKVKSKEGVPTVTKEVQESNDNGDGAFGEAADADIGDHVKFKLEGSMPANIDNFTSYKYIFHDDLSAGLTFDADSVKVTVDSVAASDYTVKTTDLEEGCDFEIVFDNIKAGRTVTKDTKVVVEYTATLNGSAVLKNENSVKLEFSADPYDSGEGKTSETPSDTAVVFSYTLNVDKVDTQQRALAGAQFKVQKWDKDSNSYKDYVNGQETSTAGAINFVFKGLDAGKYQLVETVVPDGYNAIDPIEFEIVSELEGQAIKSLTASPKTFSAEMSTGIVSTKVVNETGSILPSTGGAGTYAIYVAGALLVAGGATLVITRRKKSSKEEN